MAKLALINRELKRKACAQKFAAKRAALKAVINDATRSMEERMEARNALQSLPRDASPSVSYTHLVTAGDNDNFVTFTDTLHFHPLLRELQERGKQSS